MTRASAILVAAALAALAAGAVSAQTRTDPGISSSEIVLGGTAPLSGEASAAASVARGAEAYFKYVNSKGGVYGRKLTYKYLDDGYDPGRAVQGTRQLVQQDRVFAIYNTLGTNNNLAIRGFLNQLKVPQLFVSTGASTFGRDYKKYPWTIGYIPTYRGEGEVYGRYVLKNVRNAKIGVLYQDDDYGNDLLAGLRKGLGSKASKLIVKTAGYDPTATDVRSQIAQLRGANANVFMIFAFGKFSLQAYGTAREQGWKPKQIFINDVASAASLMVLSPPQITEGSISIVFAKDPGLARWNNDKGMKLFRAVMKKYFPPGVDDGYAAAGMASAFTMVDTLKKAGKNLSRSSVMRAATATICAATDIE